MIKLSKAQAIIMADSIIALDNRSKQEIGRRFAYRLGFTPGPLGPDDGIDGRFLHNGLFCHFQSKMSRSALDKDEARKYYSDIKAHQAEWSVMLSGVGFKDTFYTRLDKHTDLDRDKIYLLTLTDIFTQSDLFLQAVDSIPPLLNISSIDWSNFQNKT
ncbi:hypothetical protein [Endozoicomonas sp. 4G]|uniref:hypothetical protein n=1 Tax=Endozoicomonas sp. 4G TaxID=2872754 RepID=UPI002078BBD4|nr:hypothetical protein [Endozoicomonas sp. 4G]